MNELIARWKLESPKFFKELAKFGKWLTAIGASLVASKMAAPEGISDGFLETLNLVGSYMVFGGGLIVVIARLTVEDTEALKDKINDDGDK